MSVINLSDLIPRNYEAGQVIDDNGILKVQPLSFIEETPSSNGNPEEFILKSFNITGDEPSYSNNNSNVMEFYKCASVTSNGWTGYKAVLDTTTNIYNYEQNVTSGLTYDEITPTIGKTYTNDALIEVSLWDGFPKKGLIFYAPLSISSIKTETGQNMSENGNITFNTIQGIPCANFNGSSKISGSDQILFGNSPFTISIWLKSNTNEQVHWSLIIGDGTTANSGVVSGIRYAPNYGIMFSYNDDEGGISVDTTKWTHLIYIFDGEYITTYVNGQYIRDFQFGNVENIDIKSSWCIGGCNWSNECWDGYISSIRIYNREITVPQIAKLFSEFTPIYQN